MFGMRVLIFLIAVGLVVWILVRLARGPSLGQRQTKKVGDMVRCARCGVFVPRSEAISAGDRHYCSSQHRDEDQ